MTENMIERENYNRYEIARIIGARALQLSYGAPPLIEVYKGDTSIKIAKREFLLGVIPLTVYRKS
ncbi:MAG: DNA-directed RNA polymerase subunit K [Candidatus Aenigmatarchaeota archaeon]